MLYDAAESIFEFARLAFQAGSMFCFCFFLYLFFSCPTSWQVILEFTGPIFTELSWLADQWEGLD